MTFLSAQPDGTWRRDYDGGTVVVNPTYKDVTVRTAVAARDVSTGKVGAEFVIPALDGRILIRERPTGEVAKAKHDAGRGGPAAVQKE